MHHILTQTEAFDDYAVSVLLSFVSGRPECIVDYSRLLVRLARLSTVVLVRAQELTRPDCEVLSDLAVLVDKVRYRPCTDLWRTLQLEEYQGGNSC